MNWFIAAIAGTLSAIIGSMGLGGGGVLIINFKLAIKFSLLGLAGAVLGSYLACFVDSKILSKLFAIFLLFMGIMQFRKKN